jgi:hypothetical protein
MSSPKLKVGDVCKVHGLTFIIVRDISPEHYSISYSIDGSDTEFGNMQFGWLHSNLENVVDHEYYVKLLVKKDVEDWLK